MKNKAILLGSILWVSSPVFAGQSLLGSVAGQAAKDTAAVVAPEAVRQVDAENQAVENAKNIKDGVVNAPAVLQKQAQKAVKDTVKQALPGETIKAVKSRATVNKLEIKVANAPKTIERKAKQQAVESAVELLR